MSSRSLSFSFLCVGLLLCLASGASGNIDPDNLTKIINYIRKSGTNRQYAVAVRLDNQYCQNPTKKNLKAALPPAAMKEIKENMAKDNGIYVPSPLGNIVAARPNEKAKPVEHAEFRLLTGGQNSYVARLLENKLADSCLIFFSKLSPCVGRCLNEGDSRNIVQWLEPLFNQIHENSKAFVFELVYDKEAAKYANMMVDAWKRIRNASLFRWYWKEKKCIKCFDNNGQVDPKCTEK